MKIRFFVNILALAIFFFANQGLAVNRGVIGIAVEENIELPPAGLVTVYNGGPSTKAIVLTNSTAAGAVTLGSGMTIDGDIFIGPGGIPSEVVNDNGATITGNIIPAGETMFFPPIVVPTFLANMPSGGMIDNSTTLTSTGKFSGINLGHNEVLTIDGDISLCITGDISLSNSTRVVINPGSSLTLYLLGNLLAGNSQGFQNMTQDASNLAIYATTTVTSVLLKNAPNWYGVIYAPSTDVTIDNGVDLYGAVIANSFIMKNNGTFYVYIPEPASALLIGAGLLFVRIKRQS